MRSPRQDALDGTATRDVVDWWTTSISDIIPGQIHLRGYPIGELIANASFVQAIWLMVRGDLPTAAQSYLLERALVASIDHGPQAPSIAAARMAATCGVGLHGAMSTGVGLLGDVHGGAGQQCMELMFQIGHGNDGPDLDEHVDSVVDEYRAQQRFVPGFGHRFHPHDPRRDPLLDHVRGAVGARVVSGRYLQVAESLERSLARGRKAAVPMNIDGATAVVYAELGFAPALARGLFILSRSVGILAHSWEEMQGGRRIKGPIPPPLLPAYDGPNQRTFIASPTT